MIICATFVVLFFLCKKGPLYFNEIWNKNIEFLEEKSSKSLLINVRLHCEICEVLVHIFYESFEDSNECRSGILFDLRSSGIYCYNCASVFLCFSLNGISYQISNFKKYFKKCLGTKKVTFTNICSCYSVPLFFHYRSVHDILLIL